MKKYNCSDCDYCYTNETLDGMYICVNGHSENWGNAVDWLGLSDEEMDCVVVNGKSLDELCEEEDWCL